ncbi:Nitrile-specifier protein 2 [Madurella mycetomatis]|uniref:Nitrile-specifier protein 2 n=1 Tax=Madurella mycetomatis TaxID=100816 RepID=A0A175W6Y7_9PEZI|nr:Nitrile-specifier protein 2 [Madurella mycetomatis]
MDSFKLLKRRTTELFNSLPHALPSLGSPGANKMKGTWEKIQVPPLPRSSHSTDIVAGTVYIFGGEISPRQPVDNDMHVVTLPSSGAPADYYAVKAKPAKPSAPTKTPAVPTVGEGEPTPDVAAEEEETAGTGDEGPGGRHLSDVSLTTPSPGPGKGKGLYSASNSGLPDVPSPRVGHATAVIGHRIFVFGGRGGPDMAALDEGGRVWVFDTRTHLWSFLDPAAPASGAAISVPPPRSYHSAVATPKPDTFNKAPAHHHHHHHGAGRARADSWRDWALGGPDADDLGTPQRPIVGVLAERATDADSDGYGTLIIHGGCLSGAGERAADVWAFDVRSRVWQRLPDAPGSPRGGTSLALSRSRLYRFGGFNGASQEGGQLDFLELGVDSFDDGFSAGEVALCARGQWQSLVHGREDVGYKEVDEAEKPLDGGAHPDEWPGNRSVAGLEAITVGGGREYLVLIFGEREASGAGHAAAGKFWDDVWVFQVPAQGMSAASVADTVFSVVGRKSGEGKWTKVQMGPYDDEDDASIDGPGARGWIATATMGDLEENGIVVWGGLAEGNKRLGDGWIFRLG